MFLGELIIICGIIVEGWVLVLVIVYGSLSRLLGCVN